MIRRIFLVLALSAVVASTTGSARHSMQADSPPEPAYIWEFHYLDANKKIVMLEKLQPETKTSSMWKAMVPGTKANVTTHIKGKASPVRFPAAAVPSFIVRGFPATAGMNPADIVSLVKLKTSKNSRDWVLASTSRNPYNIGAIVNPKITTPDKASLPLTFEPFGTQSLKVTVGQPLTAGEYMLSAKMTQFVFCFGVD